MGLFTSRKMQVTRILFFVLAGLFPCLCTALVISAVLVATLAAEACKSARRRFAWWSGGTVEPLENGDGATWPRRPAHSASTVAFGVVAHPPTAAEESTYDLVVVSRFQVPESWNESCSICLDHLWTRTTVPLACSHRFHRDCVKKWLDRAPSKACPVCKAPVRQLVA